MTTNQQIDKLIGVVYNYEVRQQSDLKNLPVYVELCRQIFAEVPNLNERQYQNLLYILVSKKLIQIHAENLNDAFDKPISLRPETITWYEQFHSYFDYLDYLEQKNQPRAFLEDFDDPEPEETELKSIWAKIPLWSKVLALIIVIIGVLIIVTGISKQ